MPHCRRSAGVVPPRTSPAAIIRWYPRSAKSKHSAATGHPAQSSRCSGSIRCFVSASIHSAKRAKVCDVGIYPICRRSAIHCSAQAMRALGVSFAWIAWCIAVVRAVDWLGRSVGAGLSISCLRCFGVRPAQIPTDTPSLTAYAAQTSITAQPMQRRNASAVSSGLPLKYSSLVAGLQAASRIQSFGSGASPRCRVNIPSQNNRDAGSLGT